MRLRVFPAFVLAVLGACAHAQTPSSPATLPDAFQLPSTPGSALPGVDRRECGPTEWSALCAAGRWALYSRIDLRVTAPRFTAQYEMERAENGEIQATYRERNGSRARGGEIVLFGVDGFA